MSGLGPWGVERVPPAPFTAERGELLVEGIPLDELAERFGTPLYVTSESRLRENARRVRAAFEARWPEFRLLYALKANTNPHLLRILREEGCGADCSCPVEVRLAQEAGFPRERTLYTGSFPSDEELALALEAGVSVNLDDPGLLGRLLAHGTPASLAFRLNPGSRDGGAEGLCFAADSKFGTPLGRALPAYRAARAAGVPRLGVHTMPGSNILDPSHFERVARFLARAFRSVRRATGTSPAFLDMGGGLGVPYRPSESPLDLERVAEGVARGLRSGGVPASPRSPEAPELWAEPGRYLVGDTTLLLTRVSYRKEGRVPFVGVDAGMQTLLRPALYDAYHPVYAAGHLGGRLDRPVHLVGPVCENTDVLARSRRLPRLVPGDLVALGNAGAYGFSMASQYNSRPRPAEVLVVNGRARLIRERERFEDLFARVVPLAAPPERATARPVRVALVAGSAGF